VSIPAFFGTLILLTLVIMWTLDVCRRGGGTRVLVIGTTPLARQIVATLTAGRGRYRLAGIVAEGTAESQQLPLDPLYAGRLDRLGEAIDTTRPDRIVIALADRRGRLPMHVLVQARLHGITVVDGVRFFEELTGKVAIEALAPDYLVSASGFRQNDLDAAVRRSLSIVVSAVALVVLAPLLALIALAIKLDSHGPILFVQHRAGLAGRRFALLKFRTMHPAWRTISEWVGDNDGRITRIGRWLRRSRLDELPQLVNILRGDMNLVGPRPHPVCNVDLFRARIPYYSLRALVRPGLTGWAQVKQGYANGLDEEVEKMRYDLYYIKHMSAWLDLRILFDTVRVLFADHGSNVPARRSLASQGAEYGSPLDAASRVGRLLRKAPNPT
jgi:exopolysaccharide biosynthesis polyprenyl glycosylphosphotransferase